MKRITIVGDIMCERPVLKAGKQKDGRYDFTPIFEKIKPMFAESDYVIGNLEFPVAGEDLTYGDSFFVFNAPDEYAVAVKEAGIDLVSTINNHTLDRGIEGIIRTMKTLDRIGLQYTGTFCPEQERDEAFYFHLGETRFAVVAYTYGINNRTPEDEAAFNNLNCLAKAGNRVCGKKIFPKSMLDRLIRNDNRRNKIKRFLHIPTLPIQVDTLVNHNMVYSYFERFCDDIKKAKEKADFVIFYPHTGGQFNIEVGEFSKTVFEKALACGADAILASHSHCIQKAEFRGAVPCAYSLGNFNMVGNTQVTVKKFFPEYGLAMHLYMDGKRLDKVTFSITKAIKKGKRQIVTWPVDRLYDSLKSQYQKKKLEAEVRQILTVVTGKECVANIIKKEYSLE